MADEVKKKASKEEINELREQVVESQADLSKEGKVYAGEFPEQISVFDDTLKETLHEVRGSFDRLGERFEKTDLGEHLKNGWDDIKDKFDHLVHSKDKKEAEQHVSDLKDKVNDFSAKVDDTEAGKELDKVKGNLDKIKFERV